MRGLLEHRLSPADRAHGHDARCEACGSPGLEVFYRVDGVPSQSCVLLDTRHEAERYPVGDILLGVCRACGFMQNLRFEPGKVDYSKPTEESQAYSPKFQSFSRELAKTLHDRYGLASRTVLEIGCGKGDFLADVAELGIEAAVGIDPGFLSDRATRSGDRLTFIRDSFDERYAHLTADLIVTRHLLEHLPRPRQMLQLIRRSAEATPDGALFTELPDARRVLREGAFWDIYYEHCSYFTLGSLGRLLRSCGFGQDSMRLGFGDQYLLAWSALADHPGPHPAEEPIGVVLDEIDRFARTVDDEIRRWRRYFGAADEAREPVVLWGGGSKAVAFSTTVGLAGADVTVVDINPHKQGKWLAGTSLQVHDPGRVVDIDPRHVIVMNPIYHEEIRAEIARMGLAPNIVTV